MTPKIGRVNSQYHNRKPAQQERKLIKEMVRGLGAFEGAPIMKRKPRRAI